MFGRCNQSGQCQNPYCLYLLTFNFSFSLWVGVGGFSDGVKQHFHL